MVSLKNKVLMTKYQDMASGDSARAKYRSELLSVQISWKKNEIEAIRGSAHGVHPWILVKYVDVMHYSDP